MNYTQAQIDRANAVSLEDFLRTQGETLIKSGREYRWKEHDSLTVRGNKWFRHSQSKGGYPIDFVMEFYGKSFPEAVQLLTGESAEGQSEASTAPPTAFHLPLPFLWETRKALNGKEFMTLPLMSFLPGRTPPRPRVRPHRQKCSFWNCLQTERKCQVQSWKRRSMSVGFPHAPCERRKAVSGTDL